MNKSSKILTIKHIHNVNKFVYICNVKAGILKYKGIHPGALIDREMKKRGMKQRPFALKLGEHVQSLNAIVKGHRGINVSLALKIEREFDWKEGELVLLQAFFDIEKVKEQEFSRQPDISKFRRSLFWDTNMSQLNWVRKKKAIIQRVAERGNLREMMEIENFYGEKEVKEILKQVDERIRYRKRE